MALGHNREARRRHCLHAAPRPVGPAQGQRPASTPSCTWRPGARPHMPNGASPLHPKGTSPRSPLLKPPFNPLAHRSGRRQSLRPAPAGWAGAAACPRPLATASGPPDLHGTTVRNRSDLVIASSPLRACHGSHCLRLREAIPSSVLRRIWWQAGHGEAAHVVSRRTSCAAAPQRPTPPGRHRRTRAWPLRPAVRSGERAACGSVPTASCGCWMELARVSGARKRACMLLLCGPESSLCGSRGTTYHRVQSRTVR